MSTSRPRQHAASLIRVVLCAMAVCEGGVRAGQPLASPRIKDMLLVGREGAAQSTVTRSLLYHQGYLFAAGQPGLATVDARDPADLVLTNDWPDSSAQVNGMAIKDTVLYVANWSPGAGLVLFDIAVIAHPAAFRTIATAAHTWTAEVFGDLLYVGIDDGLTTGINTYDIGDPRAPALLGFVSMGDRLVGNAARAGDCIYVGHGDVLRVYNVRDPGSPQLVHERACNGLCGETLVRGGYLFFLTREIETGERGGVHVCSLVDPVRPAEVEFWESYEPRDMQFLGDLLVVPASGSGIYTLDASDPRALREVAHWYVSWPETGHGGYPVTAAGERNHAFIGTTSGNNPECEDFATCSYYGARIYSVQIAVEPPRIAATVPDPDTAFADVEYVRQFIAYEGDPAPAWSLAFGPAGMVVDGRGRVYGWRPHASDIGKTLSARIVAVNPDGADARTWNIGVAARPAGLLAWFQFEADGEGWATTTWKSGPYDPGVITREDSGGNPGGCMRSQGSGGTNNEDTCNREGTVMTRVISTEGFSGIRIEWDVAAALAPPPGASGTGACSVLEGTSEDKLVVYYSTHGSEGPWVRAAMRSEGGDLPAVWTHMTCDLAADTTVDDNASFALKFVWQFNTAADEGRIDNVSVWGARAIRFRRGDANGDGVFDIADPIAVLAYLFAHGPLLCEAAADGNADGTLDIADPINILDCQFGSRLPLPAPFPACGPDSAIDALTCAIYTRC